MSTKTVSASQDERHFIGHPQKSTILGSIQSWFGRLPMAKFYDGEWFGTIYEIIPLNRRIMIKVPSWLSGEEFGYYWTRPYYDKNRVKFKIKIKRFGEKNLSEFNIVEDYPMPGGKRTTRELDTNKKLSSCAKEYDNTNETEFFSEGEVIYSLGGTETKDKRILVKVDFLSGDKAYAKFEEIITGGIVGAIIGTVGTLLARYLLGK